MRFAIEQTPSIVCGFGCGHGLEDRVVSAVPMGSTLWFGTGRKQAD